jgi:hypothetical protein
VIFSVSADGALNRIEGMEIKNTVKVDAPTAVAVVKSVVYVGTKKGEILTFDAESLEKKDEIKKHTYEITSLSVSNDETMIASTDS